MTIIDDALAEAAERVKEFNAKLEDYLAGYEPEPSADVSPAPADETRAKRLWDDDRRLFVRNLGWLLSQTRCGVVSCELYGDQDREYVIARYDHGRQAGDRRHCGQLSGDHQGRNQAGIRRDAT